MKFNIKRIVIIAIVSVFLVSAVVIGVNRLRARSQYNLILISVDTLRADHMGVYGYPKNTTPNIDKWAKDAFVFTNMRTQVPATYPSFAILMTGKSAFDSKIYDNSVTYDGASPALVPIEDDTQTLAEILKKNGYLTTAVMNTPSLDANLTNLNKGFDIYTNSLESYLKEPGPNETYKSYLSVSQASDWLAENKNKKFFLWVHLMEPHAPYTPAQKFRCSFNQKFCDEISKRGLTDLEKERNKLKECQLNGLPGDKVELFETLYDGAIASADILVGKILDTVKNLNIEDKTIVIFYGDHGEGFDHNFYFMHAHELYDSHTKIPFIVKIPNVKNNKIESIVQNTEIFSAIIRLLNLPYKTNNNSFFNNFFNKSFFSFIQPRYLYYVNSDLSKFGIQEGNYKYIYSIWGASCLFENHTDELYNLKEDPEEYENLINVKPDITNRLKNELFEYLKKYDLPTTLNERQNLKKKQKEIQKLNELNQEEEKAIEKLKSLGY